MHTVIIGGTGHVGTYLVPRLIESGYEVTVVSRGSRSPYIPHHAWKKVRRVTLDRKAEEANGTFGLKIQALEPDIVIDMICFELDSAQQLVEALQDHVRHFLHCSTCWVHGKTVEIPVTEDQPRQPIGEYGLRKAAIESYLHEKARKNGFPETCILPGHIVGPGWVPLNPQGNFNPAVYSQLGSGETVTLPNSGLEVVHHVHADDVAQLFMQALNHWNAAVGESFHAVSPAAMTLRGYAEAVAAWFGQDAHLEYYPYPEWAKTVSPQDANASEGHLIHSPNCYSIAKGQQRVGYQPRFTSLQAIYESLSWLYANGIIH
ncbi:MAG: NAD-dependent epimerase/dehydratase family protein [Anaerolineales bacterium]|nr:MAG: NAD-dependent epimerase/dehydratase family protein [Anaerolineales bacterium]